MNIRVFDRASQVGQAAATLLSAQILQKPDSVLGLATGSTPLDTYNQLIKLTQGGILDWSRVTTFNLDEYVGLAGSHEQSYQYFMKNRLFDQVNISPEAVYIPDGTAGDPEAESLAYERKIRQAGGIDLQLLGIGRNGHIGFNEPGSSFTTRTHCVDLTEETIADNARFFNQAEDVPRQAISMGIGTIMQARSIILLATGASKARAVAAMVQGNLDPLCPASILQAHGRVTVLLDQAAAVALVR